MAYVVPMAMFVPIVRPFRQRAQKTLGKRRSSNVCYIDQSHTLRYIVKGKWLTRKTSQTFTQSGLPIQRRISDFHVRGAYRSKSSGGRSVQALACPLFIASTPSVFSPKSPSWKDARVRSYFVSGRKKNASTSCAPESIAPRPYHHCGVMALAISLANKVQTAVRLTWIACWPMRALLRSWRKNISCQPVNNLASMEELCQVTWVIIGTSASLCPAARPTTHRDQRCHS